jgi:hypothetical protein
MQDPVYWISLLISTFIMGFAIKYIDSAYDDDAFSRKNAILAAICCGILMGYWISSDMFAAVFLLAICMCVAITKKIDNPAFILGILLALFIPAVLSVQHTLPGCDSCTLPPGTLVLPWLPLAALVIAGVIDEQGNDAIRRLPFEGIRMFFHYRLSMEVMMFVLTLSGFFAWVYFFAFAAFDLGYQMVTYYVDSKLKKQQYY